MKNKKYKSILYTLFFVILCNLAYSSDANIIKNQLNKIENEIQTSIKQWKLTEDNKIRKDYLPREYVNSRKFSISTEIKGVKIYSGEKVEGTPLILKLNIGAKGLCEAKIFVNDALQDSFSIDGSLGTHKRIKKEIQITKAVSQKIYRVRIDVENKGYKPFRTDFWPPRKTELKEEGIYFVLYSADKSFPQANKTYSEIKDWLISMKTANSLLNPEFYRYTFTGKPYKIEDKRKTSKKRLKNLNIILKRSVSTFDFDSLKNAETSSLKTSIKKSYKIAKKIREYAKEFKVNLIGNAHIDIAWLWRIYETIHVARNTYKTVINNMSEYPELHYAQSQALTYEWIEKQFPELFEKIKIEFQKGRWEIVGGMWVEPDCNLISGESWVRQILYGKKYFYEKFGIDVKTGWNIDSFGYNWNMPQIYRKSGINQFITQKILWNDTTVFPHFIFWWQGVDGTKLLSYFPPIGYTSRVQISNVVKNITKYEASTGYKKSLILYGIGNHGGGPNREILDRVRSYKKLYIAPEFIHSKSFDFLGNITKDLKDNIPVWNDELYLEYHRGTYTTQAKTKKNNRKSEVSIGVAEKLASIAKIIGNPYPQQELENSWKLILTNQFHDILPGSSITPVFCDAMELYKKAQKKIETVKNNSIKHIVSHINTSRFGKAIPIVVVNPLSWKRSDLVRVKLPGKTGNDFNVLDNEGREIPVEINITNDGNFVETSFIAKEIPPLGYKVYSLIEQKSKMENSGLNVEGYTIENKYHKLSINPETGNIKSIYDKKLKKEFVETGKEANVLQIYEDRPERWDAWNIGYTGRKWELNKADSVRYINISPVRVVLRIKKSFLGFSKSRYSPTEDFPSSFFTQDIIVYNNLDRIDIKTQADWWENHMFLKAAFPVNIKNDYAYYEIPFAAIKRTTKSNTLWEKARFEVPALKWADLSDKKCGISILNDCKYGYDIHSNTIKLSLLKSPTWPDPMADKGKHTFIYSVYTHEGMWNDSETVKRGSELNSPLIAVVTDKHKGSLPEELSFFKIKSSGVILDSLKKEESGEGIILRLYESKGEKENVTLSFFRPVKKIYETDLMENILEERSRNCKSITLNFKKFEVKTLKLLF